jgi:hypothetical protein
MKLSITTTINGLTPEKYAQKLRKSIATANSGNPVVRNVVLRYFSDFIANQSGLKEATKSGNFSKPSARPDIQGSLATFKKVFGIDFTATEVTGGAQAYAELKQRTSTDRAVSLTSLQLSGERFERFKSDFGIVSSKNEKGEATFTGPLINNLFKERKKLIEFIKAEPRLEKEIIQAIREKFENFVIIDYLDKAHSGKPKVMVLTNAANILNLTTIDSSSIDIVPRIVYTEGRKNATISFTFKLSESAYSTFIEKAIDVTKAYHNALSKNISTKFIKYAINRFRRSSSTSDLATFIQEVVSLAREFEPGTDTPIIYETQIRRAVQGSTSVGLKITLPSKQPTSPQTFISGAQWTVLTQRRLGKTMKKSGEPNPPFLIERTGRFRSSIAVSADYRRSILQYTYNPLYTSLERYGYNPDLQVETAIREVARTLYARKFAITKV